MCIACERPFDRRQFLGRALSAGGLVALAGSFAELFDPRGATAAAPPFEVDAVGEDGFGASGDTTTGLSDLGAAAGLVQAPNISGVPAPPIVRRSEWRADETQRSNHRTFTPIRKFVVHHTASANRPASPRAVIREMYGYHLGAGYADLGYNFVIDHNGIVYEGRYARRYAGNEQVTGEDGNGWGVVGGHAAGMNAAACGVVLIGDFTSSNPTDAAVASLVWLLSWKASRHRVDALNSDPYITRTGQRMTTENITGHRRIGQTSCPGRLAGLLPAIREQVAANAGRWPAVTIDVTRVARHEWTAASTVPARPEPVSTAPVAPAGPAPGGSLLPVPMAVGTRGEAVRTVQRALRSTGITVTADGIFGPRTRQAVVSFQQARGLTSSGQVDVATVSALGLTDANRSNLIVLPARRGSQGPAVRAVQRALVTRGVPVVIDGIFGNQTRAGVHQFQRANGMSASGEVDLRTAAALGIVAVQPASLGVSSGSTATQGSGSGSGSPATAATAGGVTLPVEFGMWSDDVRVVQRALTAAGYPLAPDGRFGPVTLAAVKRFQKDHGIPQTGVVHTMTARALRLS